HNTEALQHSAALEWWDRTVNQHYPVGLSWVSVLGFIRIVTNRRVLQKPLDVTACLRIVRGWLNHPNIQILTPGEGHPKILFDLLAHVGTAGNLTTDAHLAAIAIEYHAELASNDADFARFPGLRWSNPLEVRR